MTLLAPESPWMTVAEIAAYLKVSKKVVYDACQRGALRHATISGRRSIRVLKAWADDYLIATSTPIEVPRRFEARR